MPMWSVNISKSGKIRHKVRFYLFKYQSINPILGYLFRSDLHTFKLAWTVLERSICIPNEKVQSPIRNLAHILRITCISHFSPRSWIRHSAPFAHLYLQLTVVQNLKPLQLQSGTQTPKAEKHWRGGSLLFQKLLSVEGWLLTPSSTPPTPATLPFPSRALCPLWIFPLPFVIPLLSLLGSFFSLSYAFPPPPHSYELRGGPKSLQERK